MTSRLVSLLTFGLGGKRSGSMDAISASARRRISTLADGETGDYSSYSSDNPDFANTTPETSNPPSQPPSPDPHEAYILPASFTPPNHSSNTTRAANNYSLASPRSSTAPVLTGDATLDIYKQELDLLSRETDHIRGSISAYAKQLIDMALHCTDVAEKAYDVCEAANLFPSVMKLFMKTHRGLSEQAAYLFGSQLEEEIMQPLNAWDEQVDSFIRELTRTNQVRLTMMEHQKRVDAQFLRKCDRPKEWSEDEEYELKVSKSDLEATCNNYTHRCESLVTLWRNIALDRMKALEILFTRLLTQQYALFHPALLALTTSGLPGLPTAGVSPAVEGAEGAVNLAALQVPTQSPLTPPTPSGRLRAYSGDGTNVRKRSNDIFDDNQRQLLLSQFSPPNRAKRKLKEQQRLRQELRQQRHDGEDSGDDDDRQDAILQTLELMKSEMREKERLQAEMEALIKKQAESREKEESLEAAGLREKLEELERKLAERERQITGAQGPDGVVVGSDAPPPPPMDGSDVPSAPPLDDVPIAPPMSDIPDAPPGAPPMAPPMAPSGAPSAPSLFGAIKKMSARDKEVAEAKRHHLPILPAMKALEGVSVKRLHWSVVPAAEVKGTVWEQLVKATPQQDEAETGWELPLIKKDEVADEEAADTSAASDPSELQWHWALDDEFGHTFSQKATKPLTAKDAKDKKKKKSKLLPNNSAAATTTEQDDSSDEADDDSEDEEQKLREQAEQKLKKQIERVELIEAKRAYNVAISLSHFRLDYALIRNAVMLMDSELLNLEQLEVLLDILPTAEEVKQVQEYTGDAERLGDVERFFLAMSVPTLSTRLKAFVFMQTFPPLTASLHDAMSLLHLVNGRLRDSRNVRALLGIVLRMGNYMSASNGQPQVYGFQLSTLGKLRGVKSVDNKSTLLHYLVAYVQHHCPQVRNFTQELAGCRAACRIESAFLVAEVKQVQQNVRMVKLLIDDDSKRRTATLGGSHHFDFPVDGADPSAAGLFSPLSAPSLTPLNTSQTLPGHAPHFSSSFTFSQELMTPASAFAATSFPSEALPPVPERLLAFYGTTAAPATTALERQLSNIQTEYEALQSYYVCGDAPWEQFYAMWSGFVEEWLAVEEEMEVEREREMRRRRQAESAEAMTRKKREKAAEAAASKAERDAIMREEKVRRASKEVEEVVDMEKKEEIVSINLQPVFALEIDPVDADPVDVVDTSY